MPIRVVQEEDAVFNERMNVFRLPDADPSMEQLPAGISLCMIMKNEERFLPTCLESVRGVVDEICIVDTGSTDRSIEIAESFGARLGYFPWQNDFSLARNKALEMAKYRWILVLDPDEELQENSRYAMRSVGSAPASTTALILYITNSMGVVGEYTEHTHYLTRIFPNTPRMRYQGAIHERITLDDKSAPEAMPTTIRVYHRGYENDVLETRSKHSRNMPMIREDVERSPNEPFTWYNLGMAQVASGEREGLDSLAKMFELTKDAKNGYIPSAYMMSAYGYMYYDQDYDKAYELVSSCLEMTPNYANALYLKSALEARRGNREESRALLIQTVNAQAYNKSQAMVDEEITAWRAKASLAMMYLEDGNFEEAFAYIDRMMIARPKKWEVRLLHARALETVGRFGDAEIAYEKLASDFTSDEAFLEALGFMRRRRNYLKAIELINSAEHRLTDIVRQFAFIAAALFAHHLELGDDWSYIDRAKAIAEMPIGGDAIACLEEYYRVTDNQAELAKLNEYERTFDIPCAREVDFVRRSEHFMIERKFSLAAKVSIGGLSRFPTSPQLLYNGASASLQLGETDTALNLLGSLVPYPERELYMRGMFLKCYVLRDAGRYDEAQATIAALKALDPDLEDLVLLEASVCEKSGDAHAAENLLRKQLKPGKVRIAAELIALLARQSRFVEAKDVSALLLGQNGVRS